MTYTHAWRTRLTTAGIVAVGLAGAAILACNIGDQSISAPTRPTLVTGSVGPATVLFQESFEDSSFASRGWYDNTRLTTTTAQHLPGGTRALQAHFLPGATSPTWGLGARRLFTPTPTLYISYWVKYSANWVGSAKPYHPHEFMVLSDMDGDYDAPANDWLTLYLEHNYQNGGIPRMALQDNRAINTSFGTLPRNLIGVTESRSVAGCNGVVEANVVASCFDMPPWYNAKEIQAAQVAFQPSQGPGYKGDWNHVEAYYQLNSVVGGIGQADGVVQYWFNGTLVIDRHDILFRTGARPGIQFHQFLIAPYIGDGSPVDQYAWFDDLTVATGRIGGAPSASVASVTLAPTSTSVIVGGTAQLTSTLEDSSGNALTNRTVTWVSSAPAVATVNSSGLVTGVAAGTATITATSEGTSGTASVTVTTAAGMPVASVVVSPGATSVLRGRTLQLTAIPQDTSGNSLTGRTVTWVSSAPAVATVNSSGLVSGVAAGTATITAMSEGKSGTARVTVTKRASRPGTVTDLKVTGVTSSGVTLEFTEVNDGTGQPAGYDLRWAAGTIAWSSATSVFQGTCSLPMAGTAIGATRSCTVLGLTAATAYQFQLKGFRGTLKVNAVFSPLSNIVSAMTTGGAMVPTPPVASVSVTPASPTVALGQTVQLVATPRDAGGTALAARIVTWGSSNPAAALVGGNGLVTAVAMGTATITGTSEGQSGSSAVTVTVAPVASVSVSPPTASVSVGQTIQLAATPRDASGNTLTGRVVTWVSSNTGVATVNSTGRVTGVGGGSATITATSEGQSGSATVTVTVVPVASVSVSPASASVAVGGTIQLAVSLRDANGNALSGRVVTWSSSATSVATVSGSGLVTALLIGAATITATCDGQSGTSTVTVALQPPPSAAWPNEPAGYTVLADLNFTATLPSGAGVPYQQGWFVNNSGLVSNVTDTTPLGTSSVMQMSYPNGFNVGSGPGNLGRPIGGLSAYFLGFWFKVSNPWQFHTSSNTNKIAFLNAGGNTCFLAMGTDRAIWVGNFQNNDPNYYPNVNTTLLTLGVWHRIEVDYRRSGVLKVWVDGVLNLNYTNVSIPTWQDLNINPTWGGSGAPTNKTENDYFRYDNVHFSVP